MRLDAHTGVQALVGSNSALLGGVLLDLDAFPPPG